jgi:hypothetical protein
MQKNKDNYFKFTKMDKKSITAPYDQNDLSKKIQRIKKIILQQLKKLLPIQKR